MADNERARLSIKVSGRVQGVGFRWTTRRVAAGMGLVGWVRNAPDGSVEIEAEGERAVLERFLEWCRHGPDFSRVDSVSVNWGPARAEEHNFSIQH